jgi:hypothetical protein
MFSKAVVWPRALQSMQRRSDGGTKRETLHGEEAKGRGSPDESGETSSPGRSSIGRIHRRTSRIGKIGKNPAGRAIAARAVGTFTIGAEATRSMAK